MHDFVRRIEHLLSEHDCVIVPGLGGFVQNESQAGYDDKNQVYYPASKQVGFNVRLHFNDGLLAQSYQQDHRISFEEANALIADRVQELQGYLSRGKHLTLGQIGYMHRNEEGRLVFRPCTYHSFDPAVYGLRPLHCSRIVQKEIPTGEHNFARWLVAVAACLLLMLILNPLEYRTYDKNLSLQEAAILSAGSLQHRPVEEFSAKTALISEPNARAESEISASTASPVVAASNPAVTVAEQQEHLSAQNPPKYCIVVASFTNEADAQRWLEQKQLRKQFPQAGLTSKEGRTRVYVLGFDQRAAALSYLADFRAGNPAYAKSWVLVN